MLEPMEAPRDDCGDEEDDELEKEGGGGAVGGRSMA
jgi:hypothetical protein